MILCVKAARRRLLTLFTTPPEWHVPLTPADLEGIKEQLRAGGPPIA